MRCIHPTHSHWLQGLMATDSTMLNAPAYAEPAPAEGRRLLVLTGVVAIVGALISAAVSFAILVGVTPITPDNDDHAHSDRGQCGLRAVADRLDRTRAPPHLRRPAARQGSVAPACAHRHHVRAGRGDPGHHGRHRRIDHARHRPRPLVRDHAPRRSSVRRCRSPTPMSRRTPAICRARRCRWPTTSTRRARSTASTAPVFAT